MIELSRLFGEYLVYAKTTLSPSWWQQIKGWEQSHFATYPELWESDITDINHNLIQRWFMYLRTLPGRGGKPLSNSSIQRLSSTLSAVLTYAIDNDYLTQRPRFPKIKASPRVVEPFSMNEVHLMFTTWREDTMEGMFLRLGFLAGLRVNEILTLRACDVDFENKVIYIREHYNDPLDTFKPKNGRDDIVPLNRRLEECLDYAPKEDQNWYYFPSVRNADNPKPHRVGYRGLWQNIIIDSKVRPLGTHSMRHTFAQILANKGLGEYELMSALRHSSPEMARRYVNLAGMSRMKDHVREIVL